MTSSAEKEPDKVEDGDITTCTDLIRTIGYTVSNGLATVPYRQLQYMAKVCGVPSNLKKDILKRVIKAKVNGRNEDVEVILKQVQEARLRQRRLKVKAKEKSKNVVNSELDQEGKNKIKVHQGTNVKEMLKNIIKLSSAPNVTIQKTSTHTRFRALVTANGWKLNNCAAPSSTITTEHNSETISPKLFNDSTIRFPPIPALPMRNSQGKCKTNHINNYVRLNHMNRLTTATAPVADNQCINTQTGYIRTNNSYMPSTGVSVRETLLQQYQKKPAYNDHCQRVVDSSCWTGRMVGHHTNLVSADYENVRNYPNQPYNNHSQLYSNIKSCNNYQLSYNTPQKNEIACYQSKPIPNSFQATHHYGSSLYGTFQPGMQRTSTPFDFDECFGGIQATNSKTSSSNPEACMELQAPYPSFNRASLCNVPHQNQLPPHVEFPNRVSPSVTDVTNVLMESENNLDTDLGLLANMAMTKVQEVIDQTRRQQHNNGLLMINEDNSNHTFRKDELNAHDTKLDIEDIPTWQNFLEQMSTNLAPAVTIKPAEVQCKHGCHTASNSRQQQLEHEQHCFQQSIECPMIACNFTSTLSFLSTHILNDHKLDVKCVGHGSFFIDFTDGRLCSFEANCVNVNTMCPKIFCFPQLFNGRLFLIKVIGNFQSMQVIIYVQYINDHHNWKSYVACEVLRQDGLPYQWTGKVPQLTDDPLQLITGRNCFIFNMNVVDYAQNLFVLHTSICNKEIAKK